MILAYKVKTFVKTHSCISVHPLDESVWTKVTTFLIDNELSFIVELKDVTKENSNEAIGLATNSRSPRCPSLSPEIYVRFRLKSSGKNFNA